METYFNTQKEALTEAELSQKQAPNSCLEKGSFQCACGESFSVNLIDEKTLENLGTFVECEHCLKNN